MAMGMSLRSKDRHFSPARDMLRHHTRPERAYRSIIDSAVAQVFAINLVELSRQSRGRAKVALARQVAMYVAHVACGLSFTEIGSLFDRDRTTVAHACGIVEDRRDDPMFDTVVELLECAVLNMLFFPRQGDQSSDRDAGYAASTTGLGD